MEGRMEWTKCMFSKQSHNGEFDYEDVQVFAHVPNEELKPGTRVIAHRKNHYLPCANINGNVEFLEKNDESMFYNGIISRSFRYNKNDRLEYLVFFDNHHAQYVPIESIRNVQVDDKYPKYPKSINDFCEYYFNGQRTSCVSSCPEIGNEISVLLNGKYEPAIVREYSRGQELIAIQFNNFKRIEWIFRGSERIEEVKQSMNKFFEQNPPV